MRALFISYNGALEPLLLSQGIPYLQGLSKKGIEFTLLTFEKQTQQKAEIRKLEGVLREYRMEWRRLCYHKSRFFFLKIFDIISGMAYSTHLILARKIKIVHVRSYVPFAMIYIPAKLFGLKVIFDMRGMMADEYVDGGLIKKDGLMYKAIKALEKRFIMASDCIVVLTDKIKEILETFGHASQRRPQFEKIPCCVDLVKFNYSEKSHLSLNHNTSDKKFIFLYSGSLGTWYCFNEMLDFFAMANSQFPKTHFLILSRSNKEFKMQSYISSVEVGIVFYKPTFARLAGSPIKFAEYLACGIPVIINKGVGDTEKIVKDNKVGIVVEEFTSAEYKKGIAELRDLLSEGPELRKRCRRTAEKLFSLNDGVDKYYEIYDRLSK